MKAPSVPIVRQGKWECAAACLSQLTGVPMFHVKRALLDAQNFKTQEQAFECVESKPAMKVLGTILWREGSVL